MSFGTSSSLTATAATPQFSLYVPFQYSTLGVGSLPNMDASGPYRIFMQGNTSAAFFLTAPTTTTPKVTVTVGLEAWSLPAAQSRVNGAAQVFRIDRRVDTVSRALQASSFAFPRAPAAGGAGSAKPSTFVATTVKV